MITNIRDQLRRDEGEILHVYLDSLGIPTAGVGHNLPAHEIDLPLGTSITQEQSDTWLDQDIQTVTDQLQSHLPWSDALDEVRFGVLQNMGFNLGVIKLLGFHHFLGYMESGSYDLAASEMMDSKWAKQVGRRAYRLHDQVLSGVWQ
jgi:lysozyme